MCALLFFKEVIKCQEKYRIEYQTKKEKEDQDFWQGKEQKQEEEYLQEEEPKAEKDLQPDGNIKK